MHKLTQTQVKNAKPKSKPWKLADGGSLYLLVNPNGSKYWRYDYRIGRSRKTLPLGVYPEISLKRVRELHLAARELVRDGQDPMLEKKGQRAKAEPEQWACPVSFPIATDESFTARLQAEVTRLAPWSLETRTMRGRTLFGASGAMPDQVEAVARALGKIADHGNLNEPPDEGIDWNFSMPLLVRHLADDLRTFYHEAVASQPGPGAPNHEALAAWIFGEDGSSRTALGETLLEIAEHLTEDNRPASLLVRGWMIPEGHFHGGSAFPTAEQMAGFGAAERSDVFD